LHAAALASTPRLCTHHHAKGEIQSVEREIGEDKKRDRLSLSGFAALDANPLSSGSTKYSIEKGDHRGRELSRTFLELDGAENAEDHLSAAASRLSSIPSHQLA